VPILLEDLAVTGAEDARRKNLKDPGGYDPPVSFFKPVLGLPVEAGAVVDPLLGLEFGTLLVQLVTSANVRMTSKAANLNKFFCIIPSVRNWPEI